jgi:hypothetical protein
MPTSARADAQQDAWHRAHATRPGAASALDAVRSSIAGAAAPRRRSVVRTGGAARGSLAEVPRARKGGRHSRRVGSSRARPDGIRLRAACAPHDAATGAAATRIRAALPTGRAAV